VIQLGGIREQWEGQEEGSEKVFHGLVGWGLNEKRMKAAFVTSLTAA